MKETLLQFSQFTADVLSLTDACKI